MHENQKSQKHTVEHFSNIENLIKFPPEGLISERFLFLLNVKSMIEFYWINCLSIQ